MGVQNQKEQIDNAATKVEKKKRFKIIMMISVIIVIIIAIIVIGVINASIPVLSQKDVEMLVIAELEPQIESAKNELGISDVSVEMVIKDYEYIKPTVFSRGHISFKIEDDYYISKEFYELDNEDYTAETCSKYYRVDSLEYGHRIDIPKYEVSISRDKEYSSTQFKDTSGDKYSFYSGKILKNGVCVYGKAGYNSTSSDSKSSEPCPNCNGSGYVRWYADLYDEGWVDKCPMCN